MNQRVHVMNQRVHVMNQRVHVINVQVMLYRDSDHVISFQAILQPYSVACLPPHVVIDEGDHHVAARPVIMHSADDGEVGYGGGEVVEDEMQQDWSESAVVISGLDHVLVSRSKRLADLPSPPRLPARQNKASGCEMDDEEEEGREGREGSWFVRTLAHFEHVQSLGVAASKAPHNGASRMAKAHSNLWPPLPPRADAAGEGENGCEEDGSDGTFNLVTLSFVPVLAIRNLLPSPVRVAFVLEGHDAPLPGHEAASGQLLPIHHFGLSAKVSIGLAMPGLEGASEFVPVFNPNGSAPENHVTVYDEHGLLLRLSLAHVQRAQQVFELAISAPYWIMNRCTFPVQLGQKWTASNVTLVGGQPSRTPRETLPPPWPSEMLVGGGEGRTADTTPGEGRTADTTSAAARHERSASCASGSFGTAGTAGSSRPCLRQDTQQDGALVEVVGHASAGKRKQGSSEAAGTQGSSEAGSAAGCASPATVHGGASVREILQGSVAPIPFSFHWKVDVGGSKATVRLGPPYSRYSARDGTHVACEWSSAFSLDSLSADRPLTLVADGFSVDIVASISMGPGVLRQTQHKTRIVSLLPRYVACNNLSQPIHVCQVGAEEASTLRLDVGEMQVIRWHDESPHRRVRVRLLSEARTGSEEEAGAWGWSGPVSVDALGYRPLKLRHTRALESACSPCSTSANLLLHAAMEGPVTFINVHPEGENGALEVCNETRDVKACFRQAHVPRHLEEQASPSSAAPYCWDYPEAEPILQMRFVVDGHEVAAREYNMDRLGAFPPLAWSKLASLQAAGAADGKEERMEGVLMVSVVARGPTKVLLIQDLLPSPTHSLPTSLPTPSLRAAGGRGEQPTPDERKRHIAMPCPVPRFLTSTRHTVNLAGLGISIIDGRPEELVYISVLAFRATSVVSRGPPEAHACSLPAALCLLLTADCSVCPGRGAARLPNACATCVGLSRARAWGLLDGC